MSNLDRISQQIEEQMKKAFYDLINEQVISGKVDVDWFVNLFCEVRDKLVNIIKRNEKIKQNIYNSFDVELFRQMISNDVFDSESLQKLVNNTFYWIEQLQAPVRDEETKLSKQQIFSSPKEKIISVYLIETHKSIDNIEKDIDNYYKKTKQSAP